MDCTEEQLSHRLQGRLEERSKEATQNAAEAKKQET